MSLLSDVAEERPLLCVVDDSQRLDQASARTLGFVARRLRAEPVGLVFAAREPGEELRGLPELEVSPGSHARIATKQAAMATVTAGMTVSLDGFAADIAFAAAAGGASPTGRRA